MEKAKTKLKWYQKYFNKKLGYRSDYENTFWYYINQIQKKYFIYYYHYHDNKPVKKYDTRKIYIDGSYIEKRLDSWVEPALGKKSFETFAITLFNVTPFAIKLQFQWSSFVFFKCELLLSFLKPNIQFTLFAFQRNTA